MRSSTVCVLQPLCGSYNELAKTYTGRNVRPVHDLITKYSEVFQNVSQRDPDS